MSRNSILCQIREGGGGEEGRGEEGGGGALSKKAVVYDARYKCFMESSF